MKGSETQSLINDTEDDSAASSLHMDMEPVPSYESTGTYSNHLGYTFTEDDNREFKTVNGTGRVRTTSLNLEASVTLSWQDVKVSTKAKTSSLLQKIQGKTTTPAKQILHGISGYAQSGSLTVIMGASGSGKTSLLNVLNKRNLQDLTVSGQVLVNGMSMGNDIANISGYVQQEDLFVGTLTVYEHLWFNAALKMGVSYTKEQKVQRINDVMSVTGISKCKDTMIGVPGFVKGISGGESKRLAFATELLTKPPLIFCDEPTSGLDSYLALTVVKVMKQLSERGHTILCTIHQPSSQIFAMFDKLMLLSEGKVAYFGQATAVTNYFTKIGYDCPIEFNPADFLIHTLAIVPGEEEACRGTVMDICNQFDKSLLNENMMNKIDGYSKGYNFDNQLDVFQARRSGVCPWAHQAYYCSWRGFRNLIRFWKRIPLRMLILTLSGLILGAIYFQQKHDSIGVNTINGALYIITLQSVLNTINNMGVNMQADLRYFRREYENRLYDPSAYYIGRSVCDFPLVVTGSLPYGILVYWMIGLEADFGKFIIFLCMLTLLVMIATAYGHFLGTLITSRDTLTNTLPISCATFLQFSSFMHPSEVMNWLKPIEALSFFEYGYMVFVINQWWDVEQIACESTLSNMTTSMYNGMYTNTTSPYTNMTYTGDLYTCEAGKSVALNLGYTHSDLGRGFLLNFLIFLLLEFCGLLSILYRARQYRIKS